MSGTQSLEDLLRHAHLPLWTHALSDQEGWQIYQRLTHYGVPAGEAQAVVDALARRPVPETWNARLDDLEASEGRWHG